MLFTFPIAALIGVAFLWTAKTLQGVFLRCGIATAAFLITLIGPLADRFRGTNFNLEFRQDFDSDWFKAYLLLLTISCALACVLKRNRQGGSLRADWKSSIVFLLLLVLSSAGFTAYRMERYAEAVNKWTSPSQNSQEAKTHGFENPAYHPSTPNLYEYREGVRQRENQALTDATTLEVRSYRLMKNTHCYVVEQALLQMYNGSPALLVYHWDFSERDWKRVQFQAPDSALPLIEVPQAGYYYSDASGTVAGKALADAAIKSGFHALTQDSLAISRQLQPEYSERWQRLRSGSELLVPMAGSSDAECVAASQDYRKRRFAPLLLPGATDIQFAPLVDSVRFLVPSAAITSVAQYYNNLFPGSIETTSGDRILAQLNIDHLSETQIADAQAGWQTAHYGNTPDAHWSYQTFVPVTIEQLPGGAEIMIGLPSGKRHGQELPIPPAPEYYY